MCLFHFSKFFKRTKGRKDKKTKRQKDKKTKRQKDKRTKGRKDKKTKGRKDKGQKRRKVWVCGNLNLNLNLEHYPLDVQLIQVNLPDAHFSADAQVCDPFGVMVHHSCAGSVYSHNV